jgi:hypothetical protein
MSIIRFGPLQLAKTHPRRLADLKSVGPATLRDLEAREPDLPANLCHWRSWSRRRKATGAPLADVKLPCKSATIPPCEK